MPELALEGGLRYFRAMVRRGGLALAPAGSALLPDEDPDIRQEAGKFFANPDEWLDTPNPNLAGRTPNDFVKDGHDEPVRNLLRSLKYIGIS